MLAVFQFLQQPLFGTSAKCGWLMVTSILAGGIGIMVTTVGGPHDEVITVWNFSLLLCYDKNILLLSVVYTYCLILCMFP